MEHTLIAIEGTDGCGKKTQIRKLYDYLKSKKYEVVTVSFPNYDSPSSGPVKMYLGGEFGEKANCFDAYQASTLYAVDRLTTMKKLYNSLKKPTVILFDRYTQSNMIHQAGKIREESKMDEFLEWLDNLEFEVMKIPRPNKVIFLDVPVEISYKICAAREQMKIGEVYSYDIHERDKQHLVDSYCAAKYVADKYHWTIIPCAAGAGEMKSIDEIHDIIKKEIKAMKIKQ